MASSRKQFKIYGPAHFAATWKLYLEICDRDGTNASREIRKYVKSQVDKRAPGNPQRPLTAFVEGHEDAVQAAWSTTLKELIAYADHTGRGVTYREVLQVLGEQGLEGHMLVARAGSMCDSLKAVGVTVSY